MWEETLQQNTGNVPDPSRQIGKANRSFAGAKFHHRVVGNQRGRVWQVQH